MPRRLGPALLTLALVLGAAACGGGDPSGPGDRPAGERGVDTAGAVPSPTTHELTGRTPDAVEGRDGYFFIGTDFTLGCGSGGPFEDYLDTLADLATVIADSGRDVVWTIAPDKSTTLVDRLPDDVPQGDCFRQNREWQEHLLSTVEEPHYVDSLAILREADAAGEQVYWRGDSHWTSYGASLWLLAALERLDPSVVDTVEITDATAERNGDLYVMADRDDVETAPSRSFSTGATMKPVRGARTFDPGADEWGPLEWRNVPGDGLLRGRTLLIGDSFSYAGIDLTMPLMEQGAFAWFQYLDTTELARQVADSDTVVIEISQRTLTNSSVAMPAFVEQVEAALGG